MTISNRFSRETAQDVIDELQDKPRFHATLRPYGSNGSIAVVGTAGAYEIDKLREAGYKLSFISGSDTVMAPA